MIARSLACLAGHKAARQRVVPLMLGNPSSLLSEAFFCCSILNGDVALKLIPN